MEDDGIVALYFARNEQALEETANNDPPAKRGLFRDRIKFCVIDRK